MPYLPQLVGGLNANTHELAQQLVARGHHVSVLARLSYGNTFGVRHLISMYTRGRRRTEDNFYGYRVIRSRKPWKIAAQCQSHDLVVIQDGSILRMAAAFSLFDKPIIAYFHGLEFEDWQHDGRQAVAADLPMTGYVANSNFTAARFHARYGLSAAVVPPVFHVKRYRTEVTPTCVTFINPVAEKGVDLAIAIARGLPDIPFRFVKAWPLPPRELMRLRKKIGDVPNIELCERTRDMREIYRHTRILLVPSQWEAETWGRVVSEAHYSGIPTVASDRGGLPESVGPGGLVLAHNAPAAQWIDAVGTLWSDERLYREKSAAARDFSDRPALTLDAQIDTFLACLSTYASSSNAGPPPAPRREIGVAHPGEFRDATLTEGT